MKASVFMLIGSTVAQLAPYPNVTQLSHQVSTGCQSALEKTVNCDPYLASLAQSDYYGSLNDPDLAQSICDSNCPSSLASFHASVESACSNDPQPWDGIPAVWAGDFLWATWNRTCLKDPATGQYCMDYIGGIQANLTDDTDILSLPTSQLCSTCMLSLFQTLQSTAFSNYGTHLVDEWVAIQSRCSVSYPTAVMPPITNVTSLPGYADSSTNKTCLSGKTYTVKTGDDCNAIAINQNVPTDPLKLINDIFPDCSNLLGGAQLCLPQTCTIYTVQNGDTCFSIAQAVGISVSSLIGYNPSINSDCSNILSGSNICVAPPGGIFTPTTIPGASGTKTYTYASSTVAPPGPVPRGTTPNCGKYYNVTTGDTCQQISLNNGVDLMLFEDINSSINSECTNLVPGLFYCIAPVAGWNVTGTTGPSTTIAPPGPTISGTTGSCYEWHTVASGDTCSLLENVYGITMAMLQTWNPSINDSCTNLEPGEAYCVDGLSSTSVSSPAASKTATTQ